MAVSAGMVRELREKTSAGMLDCKKALEETQGDFEAAVEWLRKKGLASAAKKSDRLASEGMVTAFIINHQTGVLLETNSETDFVAKNEMFRNFVSQVTETIANCDSSIVDISQVENLPLPEGRSVGEALKESIAKIGENLVLRRFVKIKSDGYVHSYIHGDGKIGVLVEISAYQPSNEIIRTFTNDMCLQVAAMNPLAISMDQVPSSVVEKEKEILRAKNLEQGKKPEMVDKIVEGQIRKFLAENCLLEQEFVKNSDQKVKDYWSQVKKTSGVDFSIKQIIRFELGEGLQKKANNFAEEVAAQTKAH